MMVGYFHHDTESMEESDVARQLVNFMGFNRCIPRGCPSRERKFPPDYNNEEEELSIAFCFYRLYARRKRFDPSYSCVVAVLVLSVFVLVLNREERDFVTDLA